MLVADVAELKGVVGGLAGKLEEVLAGVRGSCRGPPRAEGGGVEGQDADGLGGSHSLQGHEGPRKA